MVRLKVGTIWFWNFYNELVVFLSIHNKPDATLICLMRHPEEFEN